MKTTSYGRRCKTFVEKQATGRAGMLGLSNETPSCKPNSIRQTRRFDSSKRNASASNLKSNPPPIAPMISLILSSKQRPRRNADNNRDAPRPSEETTRTCRHVRNKSICPTRPKFVLAVASRWKTSATATIANNSKLKSRSIVESFAANVIVVLATVGINLEPSPRRCRRSSFPRVSMAPACGFICCWKSFTCSGQLIAPSSSFGCLGLSLAAGTINDGLRRIEPLFTPLYEAILARHVQSAYFQADETRWKVFVEKAGKTGHLWWLWLFAGEDSVVYVLDPSRSHDVPQSHFPDDVQGVMMVDRYSGYKAMQQVKEGKLLLAFCWAHVRRDFVRVGKGYPELTAWALGWLGRIRELYRLNRERLQHSIGSDEFAAADATLRQHVAAMAAQRDVELAEDKLREPCRKVLVSLHEHWSGLTLFVDDPRIPLDNNYGERLIRNPAVGRKNYYGSRYGQQKPELYLYDVTSSYFEGVCNELAAFGYNRDGKRGKMQVVYGLLCDAAGVPVSISAFDGNTTDTKTFGLQIHKVAQRFGGAAVTLVGDRGMIKGPQIEQLQAEKDHEFHYITAITKPQIETLLKQGVVQMELFDEQVAEVTTDDGMRYVLRRNPTRAAEMAETRQSKYAALEQLVKEQNAYLAEHPRASVAVAQRKVEAKWKKLRLPAVDVKVDDVNSCDES